MEWFLSFSTKFFLNKLSRYPSMHFPIEGQAQRWHRQSQRHLWLDPERGPSGRHLIPIITLVPCVTWVIIRKWRLIILKQCIRVWGPANKVLFTYLTLTIFVHRLHHPILNLLQASEMSLQGATSAGSLFHSSNIMISRGSFIQHNSTQIHTGTKSMRFLFSARFNIV